MCADVAWADAVAEPVNPVPPKFWMPVLPWTVHAVWYATNASGRLRYALDHRRGAFPWQGTAAEGADLPDRVPAGDARPAHRCVFGSPRHGLRRSRGNVFA